MLISNIYTSEDATGTVSRMCRYEALKHTNPLAPWRSNVGDVPRLAGSFYQRIFALQGCPAIGVRSNQWSGRGDATKKPPS